MFKIINTLRTILLMKREPFAPHMQQYNVNTSTEEVAGSAPQKGKDKEGKKKEGEDKRTNSVRRGIWDGDR
jgi:hypothetical protein